MNATICNILVDRPNCLLNHQTALVDFGDDAVSLMVQVSKWVRLALIDLTKQKPPQSWRSGILCSTVWRR
jgi:hypothetical protein